MIETDEPRARYWGLQLATMGWFEQVDPIHRITSINHRQAIPSADGLIRFVLAHEDPGVPNWLDTAGHPVGLLTYRWFWPESDPTPSARLVPFDALRDVLPRTRQSIDPATPTRRDPRAEASPRLAFPDLNRGLDAARTTGLGPRDQRRGDCTGRRGSGPSPDA